MAPPARRRHPAEPRREQEGLAVGEAAEQRYDGEDGHPDDEDPAAAMEVSEPAAAQQQAAERQ